jgi:UDP-galactopyranose mutase
MARPGWHLVMIGPVVKVDPNSLPKQPNIHYLGAKSYKELPSYLAGWDAAMLPFAKNDSTRFISPTKTPEYLAGGKPVISTPIRDVVRPYGERGLVWIAEDSTAFVQAGDAALAMNGNRENWLSQVDEFLAENSWDLTWSKMRHLIQTMIRTRNETGVGRATGTAPVFAAGD